MSLTSTASQAGVVIVEDHALIVTFLRTVCESFGATVLGDADTGEAALQLIRSTTPSHILMDVRLDGDLDGADIAYELQSQGVNSRIIFVTGSSEPATIQRLTALAPHRILHKPINPTDLLEALS